MKKFFVTALICLCSFGLFAQDDELFLMMEFMKVEEGNHQSYLEVEEFWSGIHKQRAIAGDAMGWDLWSLEPSATDQGFQYATVNLYGSMDAMMKPGTMDGIMAYAQKAYPDMSEDDIMKKMEQTSASRDRAVRVYMRQILSTEGGPEMEVGMVATFDYMMAKSGDYVKMEEKIFMPWHQEAVEKGEKSSWGLLSVILPMGSDRYFSHMTVNFYENMGQFTKSYMSFDGDAGGMMENMAVREALKTRDMKSVHLAQLLMMVRN